MQRCHTVHGLDFRIGTVLDNDLVTLTLPEAWGGQGLTVAEYVPVLEEVAKISGALRMIVHGSLDALRGVRGPLKSTS